MYYMNTTVQIDFWQPPSIVGKEVHFMLGKQGAGKTENIVRLLSDEDLNMTMVVDDMQK